jgi:hypothetical protein
MVRAGIKVWRFFWHKLRTLFNTATSAARQVPLCQMMVGLNPRLLQLGIGSQTQ